MASPWRREAPCMLFAGTPAPARLIHVSGSGAEVQTRAVPAVGSPVVLQHPVAGPIDGCVVSVGLGRVGIAFGRDEHSVGFALAAIAADMSRDHA